MGRSLARERADARRRRVPFFSLGPTGAGAVFDAIQHKNRVFAALALLQILAMPLGIAVVCA